MPESTSMPGVFYAFPDSPDRVSLIANSKNSSAEHWQGPVTTTDGEKQLDVFVPAHHDAQMACTRLSVELDLNSIGPMNAVE